MKVLLGILLMLPVFAAPLSAAEAMIVGPWHLEKWLVITKDGRESEFCKGAEGILLYEESGYVSTSINCPAKKILAAEPADVFERQFFYAGTYSMKDDVIYKDVLNATVTGLLLLVAPFGPRRRQSLS